MPETVSFDVAVSAKRSSSTGGGLSVQIASIFTGDGKVSRDHGAEEVSRIAFDVKWRSVERVSRSVGEPTGRYDELRND